jgi:hypothetical protein
VLKFLAAAAIRGSRTGLFQAHIRIVVQVIAASILPKVAFSKDAFPNRRLTPSNRPKSDSCQIRAHVPARLLSVKSKAQ